MKKIILLILTLAFTLSFYACEQPFSEEELAAIYVNPSISIQEPIVDENAPSERTVTINGIELTLEYRDSLNHGILGIDDYYTVNGNSENVVCLSRNGLIKTVEYYFGKIDLPDKASAEDVRILLVELAIDLIDLSKYQNISLRESNDKDGNLIYYFTANNILQERYITEGVTVKISADGNVLGLKIDELLSDVSGINVNAKSERRAIDDKYQDVYEQKGMRYKSFEFFTEYASFMEINGEVYVHYGAVAKYRKSFGKDMSGWLDSIFVPLRLISD